MRGRGGDAPHKLVFAVEKLCLWHVGQLKASLGSGLKSNVIAVMLSVISTQKHVTLKHCLSQTITVAAKLAATW